MDNQPISIQTTARIAGFVKMVAEAPDLEEPHASTAIDTWDHRAIRVTWRCAGRQVDVYMAVDLDVPVRLTIRFGGVGYNSRTDVVKDLRLSGDRIRGAIEWLRTGGPNNATA